MQRLKRNANHCVEKITLQGMSSLPSGQVVDLLSRRLRVLPNAILNN